MSEDERFVDHNGCVMDPMMVVECVDPTFGVFFRPGGSNGRIVVRETLICFFCGGKLLRNSVLKKE